MEEVRIPPLPEQHAIASVLSSLDDKIDLLRRQNKTMEAVTRTVWRQWFVEQASAKWPRIAFSDLALRETESVNPLKTPTMLYSHYSIPAFDETGEPKREFGGDIRSNKYRVFSRTILISKLNPRFPRVWATPRNLDPTTSICSTEFQVCKPKDDTFFNYLYFLLSSEEVSQYLDSSVGGTSGSHQRVDPKVVFALPLLMPPISTIRAFNELAEPLLCRTETNRLTIHSLAQTRSLVLSGLMSRQIELAP